MFLLQYPKPLANVAGLPDKSIRITMQGYLNYLVRVFELPCKSIRITL
jgi:hypothetical protein